MNPLDQFMRETGMTETEMAGKLGVSQPYVGRLRKGVRRPSLAVALKLSDVTGRPASDFAWDATPEQAA